MAKVAREMVERAGVDVDRTLELLVKNAAAGLPTCYTILRANLIGLRGSPSRRSPKSPGRGPQALVPRIYELGGKLPQDMVKFHNLSPCPHLRPSPWQSQTGRSSTNRGSPLRGCRRTKRR